MDDFSRGFFDTFMGGMFADSPATLVIIIIIILAVMVIGIMSVINKK